MINVRYHLLALAAVTVAVASGLALGSAVVDGPANEDLRGEAQSLRTSNTQLRDRLAVMEDELTSRERYVRDAAPLLLDDTLADTRVLVLALPGATGRHVDAVARNLRLADAEITGTVRVTAKLTDPAYREDARDLATRLLPPNVTDIPDDADGAAASAAVLAAALVEHQPAVAAADRTAAVAGYRAGELIDVDGELEEPAQSVVVVAGPPASGDRATERSAAVLTLVERFGGAAPAVLVSADARHPVSRVRRDASLSRVISTVDDVSTALGQLSAALALVERTNDQKTGHYGVGAGAEDRIPKPTGR